MKSLLTSFVPLLTSICMLAVSAIADDSSELKEIGGSFDGWKHGGNWQVTDGVFHRSGGGGSLTYVAQKVPDDFELRFEWKVAEKSNSGVYYGPGQVEYQILDNATHADGRNPRTSAASVYFCLAPAKDATKPVGEWNKGRIVRKGTVIQHYLNGEKVIDFDYTDSRWAKDVERLRVRGGKLSDRGGNLWLQDHGDPVWYRNIRLRSIPEDEVVTADPDFRPMDVSAEASKKMDQKLEAIRKRREQAQKAKD